MVVSTNWNTTNSLSIDKLFLIEAQLVCRKFARFGIRAEVETSVSHLMRLDTIIVDAANSLAREIEPT